MRPTVKEFFDPATWTLTYVVYDPQSNDAIVIDPVWDYDPAGSALTTDSCDKVVAFVKERSLVVHSILETHAHADHVSGAQILRNKFPNAKIGIGANIREVQSVFKKFFNLSSQFKTDGSQFDVLLEEGKPYFAGSLKIEPISTPGHTPACASYLIGDTIFSGDALFMPDYGTGRCDFPAGSADQLYTSVHEKLYKLPDATRVFTGHDYQPGGRPLKFESTIGEQKEWNVQLKGKTTRAEFVDFRNSRDKGLPPPRLLLPSVQINIDAGHLPIPDDNGSRYLRIPVREK